MKTKFLLLLVLFAFTNSFSQNEEFANTYVYTFNNYFYPWGNDYLNENSCWYNPYNQFSLFEDVDIDDCQPNGNSRFNLINLDYSNNPCFPSLYCDNHYELGPGINGSGSIRITIKNEDDDGGGIPQGDPRSRVEMCYYPKHFNGASYTANVLNETYYYRWSFFIPNNNDFVDDELSGSYHIISQFHQPLGEETFDPVTGVRTSDPSNNPINPINGDQPPLFIVYIHEENPSDNKRDIKFLYGYRNNNFPSWGPLDRSSGFTLSNGITKGEWNTIILKIKWSPVDNVGFMKAWINDQIVNNSDTSINEEESNPNYGTSNPEIIKGANMLLTQEGIPLPNTLKFGHYRKFLDTKAVIYFDDLIITQDSLFAFNGFKTKLTSQFCDVELSENLTIEATPLPNVTKYKFKFSQVNGPPFQLSPVMIRDDNFYNILDNESYFKPGETYSVEVTVKVEGETSYRDYHTSCTITIPTQTKLQSKFCDVTLDITNMEIKCNPIPNTTNYKFRFNDGNTTHWVDSNVPTINLLDYSFIQPNTTYVVDVRAQGDNFDYSYGQSCSITIPFQTKIVDAQCGFIPLWFNNVKLECYPIPNATNYKFRFKDGNNTYYVDRPHPYVNTSTLNFIQYDKWYDVDVKVQVQDAGWDYGYGACCPVYIYFKKLALAHTCGVWGRIKSHEIYPNPVASILHVENTKPSESYQVFDSYGNIVAEGSFSEGQNIDLSRLRKGLYFIRIYSGENEGIFYKIVKEKIQ